MRERRVTIGLTGTLGAGKSTALEELARLGAATACADALARRLSGPGKPISRAVRRLFGPGYLRAGGAVDRSALARLVFADRRARRLLERASHPLILAEVRRVLARSKAPVAVIDAPVLFEAGLAKDVDLTVTVSAPETARLARAGRRGLPRAEALRRMRAQWRSARKEKAADVVWRNAGRRSDFLKVVRQYYRAWELMARSESQVARP